MSNKLIFGLPQYIALVLMAAGCTGEIASDAGLQANGNDALKAKLAFEFPDDFVWGAAASAYQTEGNNDNDWERAIEKDRAYPKNGDATDYYNRYDQDHALAKDLGLKMFRFGVEWSRIEPEKGRYDQEQIDHYRAVLLSMKEQGLSPMLTLHHFTNPTWLADEGGWNSPGVVEQFAAYAQKMAQEFGDLVDHWATINEPMVYLTGLTLGKVYPGGRYLDWKGLRQATSNLIFAHAAAADAIRQADTVDSDGDDAPALIVLVQPINPTSPAWSQFQPDIDAAKRYDDFYNQTLLKAWILGDLDLSFGDSSACANASKCSGHFDELEGRADMLGINYYTRAFVTWAPSLISPVEAAPCPVGVLWCGTSTDVKGDNGNEIYAPGIYDAIESLSRYGLPMMITENGVADEKGHLRAQFVVMHLMQVARAIENGYDVRGYLHWSLTDNYEWDRGYQMRFGLYQVDYDTQERTLSEGGLVYFEIVENNAITKTQVDVYDLPDINPLREIVQEGLRPR